MPRVPFELADSSAAPVGRYEPLHENGHTTYNFGCGGASRYNQAGCEGNASFAVASMPASVEQIFSDIGDEVSTTPLTTALG